MTRKTLPLACMMIVASAAMCAAIGLDPDMYCGVENCYDVLHIDRGASVRQIKRSYRQLSREYHPDRNQHPNAQAMFIKIATANEVLGDEETREAYDYYLDHPEERWRNKYNFYRFKYAPKTDLRLVLLGFVAVVSIVQYVSAHQRYKFAQFCLRRDKRVLKKAQALVQQSQETSKRATSRKKQKRATKQEMEDAINEVIANGVLIRGGFGKPSVMRDTLVGWLIFFPRTAYTFIRQSGRWIILYYILKRPYSQADRVVLTIRALSTHRVKQWREWEEDEYDDLKKQALVDRELWIPSNMAKLQNENARELFEKREGRYKQHLRQMRKMKKRI
eukprot:g4768.t1